MKLRNFSFLVVLAALAIGASYRSNAATSHHQAPAVPPTHPHVLCCLPPPDCDGSLPDCPPIKPPFIGK